MPPRSRHYSALGTIIASELELPDLREVEPVQGAPVGTRIRLGVVPEHLDSPPLVGPAFEADEKSFLLKSPQLRCLVGDGREVTVEVLGGADEATVQTFILGAPLAALCYQRGLVPLSATAVEANGGAVAFVGASGSGKSTLGAFLTSRGFALLSDDLLPVTTEPKPVAFAYRRRLRLWRDVLDLMGLDHRQLEGDRHGIQRYRLEPPRTAAGPLPLQRLYMLGAWPDAPPDRFEPLQRLDAIAALADTLVMPALSPLVSGPERRFRQLVSIVGKTSMVRWTRTLDFDDLEAQLEAVVADVTEATA